MTDPTWKHGFPHGRYTAYCGWRARGGWAYWTFRSEDAREITCPACWRAIGDAWKRIRRKK